MLAIKARALGKESQTSGPCGCLVAPFWVASWTHFDLFFVTSPKPFVSALNTRGKGRHHWGGGPGIYAQLRAAHGPLASARRVEA